MEWFIKQNFEGKSAHRTTQYLRGSLFVYIDYLIGYTYDPPGNLDAQGHPFEVDEV